MNFIQQAYKGINDFWRYLLVILLVIIGWQLIGILPLIAVAASYVPDHIEFLEAAKDNFTKIGIDNNLFFILMITMFIFGLVALAIGVKVFHKRAFKTVVTSRKQIDWKRFFFSFSLWFFISTLMIVISYLSSPETFVWNFKPLPFLFLVLIAFILMPFQTSFEELLFRGYLMQGFGILVRNRWFPLIITSVIFGLLHGFNPEVDKLGPMIMVYYIGTGLFLGMLTLLDEGTELSLGFHAANNISAAIFVTQTWTVFQTDALFVDNSEPSLGFETFLPVFVLYPILLFIFAKKYNWVNIKEKLIGKIEKSKENNFFEEETYLEV